MKKILSVVLTVAMLFAFAVSVSAEDLTFEFELDESYVVANAGDDLSELAAVLGVSEETLQSNFDKNGLLMIAADKNNSNQVQLSAVENEFSELVGDMSTMSEDELKEIANELVNENAGYAFEEKDGCIYIVIAETLSDSGGTYTVTQYCTVKDGVLYRLSFYTSGTVVPDTVYEAFETFRIIGEDDGLPIWVTLLIVVGIAAFAALAVWMVIGIAKERAAKDRRAEDYTDTIL